MSEDREDQSGSKKFEARSVLALSLPKITMRIMRPSMLRERASVHSNDSYEPS